MREGELLALKWKNVDLEKGFIHVDESIKTVKVFNKDGNGEMRTLTLDPKTKNSIRDIFLPDILIEKLKAIPHTSEYVFSNNNQPVTHKSLYFQWSHLLKNDPNITYRKFHALRHTYASLLLANRSRFEICPRFNGAL